MRSYLSTGLGIATLAAVTSLGCFGTQQDAAGNDENTVQPGHGNASVSGATQTEQAQSALAPAGEPEDGLEEPADGLAEEKEPAAADDGVAQTNQALSTSTGTTFDLTYYVIALRPKDDANTYTIRDCNGSFLTYASRAFRDDAIMQGTARFRTASGESRAINAGDGCWISLPWSQRFGLGVTNPATGKSFELRPFRSIAVDRSVLTIGKWYYIKQLDGVRMPYPVSTMVHDGCVRAVDVGSAVGGRHIDFYVAYRSAYQKLIGGSSTMGGRETVTVYSGTEKCAKHIQQGY